MYLTIYPLLARAAIKQKQAREIWLWTVLRALDSDGQGWVELEDVKEAWRQSDKNLRRIISAGEGTYWHSTPERIFMKSTYNVGMHLESSLGQPVEIPRDLCRSIGKFKAQCFAAWFWKERTISIASLERLFGVTGETIRKWARMSGVESTRNIAFYEPPEDGLGMPSHTDGGVWFSGGICYFQIPNTYCNRDVSLCARHRRTEKRLRQALKLDEGQCGKLYFSKHDKACRALQSGQKRAFVSQDKSWHSEKLWCYYALP